MPERPPADDLSGKAPLSQGTNMGYVDQMVARFGGMLTHAAQRGGVGRLLCRIFRSITLWLTLIYFFFGTGLCLAMRLVGERNIASAFLLYLPPAIWFIPLVPLMLLGLLFHRRCFLGQVVAGCLLLHAWIGYPLGSQSVTTEATQLSVMTYNRGENMNKSLQPFKNATRPDIIVFQDAGGRADGYLHSPDYAEFGHAANIGEYTVISRYPITGYSLMPAGADARSARAARFVIDWSGKPVSIYAVHLMTPRDVLGFYMRGAFLWGVLGVPGTPGAAKRRDYQKFWDQQMADAQEILNAVRADSNPCILAGDFNAPHTGYIHGMMTAALGDAHSTAGHGFGFTFPGVTRNPLSLRGPWMRIDYILFDRHWKADDCITEKDRPSQHRAVFAKLRYVK